MSVVPFEPVTSVLEANKESNKAQCASKQHLGHKQNSHNTKCRCMCSSIHGRRSHIREKRAGEEEAAAPSLTDHLFSGQQRGAWGRGA